MAKPILRYKVNQQSAEVGGKYYGIIEDTPVTPENSILQICEFKKITAFTPEQVLRLVEDVCDGAAKLVSRDGQSRQISSLLKFSPRVRGTFAATDSRWTDQRLIVGARLLKDIKLEMSPSNFVMSNVADVGVITSAAFVGEVPAAFGLPSSAWTTTDMPSFSLNVNGSKLETWSTEDTFAKVLLDVLDAGSGEVIRHAPRVPNLFTVSDLASNGFQVSYTATEGRTFAQIYGEPRAIGSIVNLVLSVKHPTAEVSFKDVIIPLA